MAFLDNSGDIILDAVLTDTGRMRLAKGDGSFKIVKFALGDDEINYELFDKNDSRGSAYYDLAIMQTPVLEAFTNNTSLLKHKLMSFPRTNLLYLPVIKINDIDYPAAVITSAAGTVTAWSATETATSGQGTFILPVDSETSSNLGQSSLVSAAAGAGLLGADRHIVTLQGEDTEEKSFNQSVESDLLETQYIIQMDDRLMKLTNSTRSDDNMDPSYVDDDLMASYYLTRNGNTSYVQDITPPTGSTQTPGEAVISGPKGTKLMFNLNPTDEVVNNTYLFDTLGGGQNNDITVNGKDYYFIDTNVRVTGLTTGYSIDIPVRVMKYYT